MTKVKANFAEHRIDVGLDVHKRSWNAAIFLNGMYVRNIHQPPCPLALKKFLEAHYPGAHYRCAYESGKFGYWIHREFSALGIDCLVINPADIPSTHKDEIYKNDCRDARGLGQALSAGQLKSIYVPLVEQEADRNLLRHRKKLWRDLVRCKNRVKGFLDYLGVALPAQFDNANWSHNFIHWLQQLSFEHPANRMTLDYQIREVQMLRRELLNISNDIRKLMRSKKYKDLYYLLRTISGIGPLTAAALITEIGDMKRFPSFYHLREYWIVEKQGWQVNGVFKVIRQLPHHKTYRPMSPQVSENLLCAIYVETDDLLKAFQQWNAQKALGTAAHPTREPELSASEIATILIAYHLSGYKCFEYYYKEYILKRCRSCFPQAPTYQCFVSYEAKVMPLLFLLLMYKCSQSVRTGYYFIDSKKLEVCHLRREKQHKIFQGFARKGKSSVGWFYGLKLHLVINHLGQIVSFLLTPANTADNNHSVLQHLLAGLKGKCAGDKGYFTTLFEQFFSEELHLLVKPKRNMKPLPAFEDDVRFLKQRPLIESVNDILTTVCDVEHTRHRNPLHGFANVLAGLIAYQYIPNKPHLFIPKTINYLQFAA